MGRRNNANSKALRRKEQKRQRMADKTSNSCSGDVDPNGLTPNAARLRMQLLREATLRGDAPSPKGLLNLGNTCYFNCIMQNVARVACLRNHFIGAAAPPGEGAMTSALRSFLVEMWDTTSHSALNLSSLLDHVAKANTSFVGRAQHDAHELLRVVFDTIVEEERKRLALVARGIISGSLANVSNNSLDYLMEEEVSTSVAINSNSDEKSASENELEDDGCGEETSSLNDSLNELVDPDSSDVILLPPPPSLPIPVTPGHLSEDSELYAIISRNAEVDLPIEPNDILSDNEKIEASSTPITPGEVISIIEKTFGGYLSSTVVCTECGSKSSVDEQFFDLQLSLVPKSEHNIESDINVDKKRKGFKRGKKNSAILTDQELSITHTPDGTGVASHSLIDPANISSTSTTPCNPLMTVPSTAFDTSDIDVLDSNSKSLFDALSDGTEDAENCENSRDNCATSDLTSDNFQPLASVSAILSELPREETTSALGDDYGTMDCAPSLFDDSDLDNGILNDVPSHAEMYPSSKVDSAKPEENSQSERSSFVAKKPSSSSRRGGLIFSFLNGFGGSGSASHSYMSVVSCLEEFTKVEILEGENAYGCEECTRRERVNIAMKRCKEIYVRSRGSTLAKSASGTASTSNFAQNCCLEFKQSKHAAQTNQPNSPYLANIKKPESATSGKRIIVSSPVTSSESSSGVSSEDDGDPVAIELARICCMASPLTRDEEDTLIERLKIKAPVVRTRASKQMVIKTPPKVLVIQLKRFTQAGYRGGFRKVSGHVEFETKLDLTRFVDSGDVRPDTKDQHVEDEDRIEFELTGVAVHCGSLSGGHYVSYVRESVESNSRGPWYLCNDSRVSRSNEKDVLGSEAYLLFYERVGFNTDGDIP